MVTLVTGANGFVGKHFCAAFPCVSLQYEGKRVDIRNYDLVRKAIKVIEPKRVVHLAGQAFVPESFHNPTETLSINLGGTLNLLSALKDSGFSGRILYISSADVYGRVGDLPLREDSLLRPISPYAVSKLAAEALCYQQSQSEGLDIVVARPFNHVGPGQSNRFVLSDVAQQLVAARSNNVVLVLGDIDVTRDYCDVADIIAAYGLLLDRGVKGEIYNVCSGQERSVRQSAVRMGELIGIEVDFMRDPSRIRPVSQRRTVGDNSKIGALGWAPRVQWDHTLRKLLDYWRNELEERS